jgi:MSHA biogenesis protein MshP
MIRARGFTLVSAVFIIVVVALLAAALVQIATTGRQISTLSLLGVRAHFAAASGMERAIQAALTGGCSAVPASFVLAGAAASGWTVSLGCAATAVAEGTDNYQVYALQATAARGAVGGSDFVSRTLTATVTNAP